MPHHKFLGTHAQLRSGTGNPETCLVYEIFVLRFLSVSKIGLEGNRCKECMASQESKKSSAFLMLTRESTTERK